MENKDFCQRIRKQAAALTQDELSTDDRDSRIAMCGNMLQGMVNVERRHLLNVRNKKIQLRTAHVESDKINATVGVLRSHTFWVFAQAAGMGVKALFAYLYPQKVRFVTPQNVQFATPQKVKIV